MANLLLWGAGRGEWGCFQKRVKAQTVDNLLQKNHTKWLGVLKQLVLSCCQQAQLLHRHQSPLWCCICKEPRGRNWPTPLLNCTQTMFHPNMRHCHWQPRSSKWTYPSVLAEALKWPHSLISPKGTILLASLRLIYFNLTKTQAEGTSITLDNTATDSHHAVLFMVLVCFTEQTLKPYHPEHYVVPGVPQLNNTHLQTWTITIFFSSGADNFTGDLCTNAQPGSCGSANSLSSVTLLQSEDRSLQPEAASITHASSPASNTYDSSTICSIRIWTWSLQWSSLGKTEVTWMTTYLYDITKSLGSMRSKTSICLLREADS